MAMFWSSGQNLQRYIPLKSRIIAELAECLHVRENGTLSSSVLDLYVVQPR